LTITRRTVLTILVVLLPIVSGGFVFALRQYADIIVENFPECTIYRVTNFYCPACGNTRSVISLTNGNIARSLRYNITPFIIITFAMAFYIELVAAAFWKHIKIVPRSRTFLLTVISLVLLYYAARNIIPALSFYGWW